MTVIRSAAVGLLACLALAGCGNGGPLASKDTGSTAPTTESNGSAADGLGTACAYADEGEAARPVGKPEKLAADEAGSVTLTTNLGAIAITLATDTAPCTTRSIRHLAAAKYYDDTSCHRLTKAASLSVLQCGDPTGTGMGGPGYTVPDENPRDLKQSDVSGTVVYPRGIVAMANTGRPDSGGSQFFLVYADSMLPPTYAVVGTMDDAGLAVLDKIANGGVTPKRGEGDGSPTVPVTIQTAR